MKKINLLLIFLHITLFSFSQSYKKKTPEEKAKKYTAEMVTDIQMDSAQIQKIYQINIVVSKQFDSLYASKPEHDDQIKGTISILKKRDAEFRQILSNEQFLRFDDIQRERREKKQKEKLEREQAAEKAKE